MTHGGNGVSFLQEDVDYNYAEYDSIGLMNLNIIMGKAYWCMIWIKLSSQQVQVCSEAFAMTLMICGPGLSQLTSICIMF